MIGLILLFNPSIRSVSLCDHHLLIDLSFRPAVPDRNFLNLTGLLMMGFLLKLYLVSGPKSCERMENLINNFPFICKFFQYIINPSILRNICFLYYQVSSDRIPLSNVGCTFACWKAQWSKQMIVVHVFSSRSPQLYLAVHSCVNISVLNVFSLKLLTQTCNSNVEMFILILT